MLNVSSVELINTLEDKKKHASNFPTLAILSYSNVQPYSFFEGFSAPGVFLQKRRSEKYAREIPLCPLLKSQLKVMSAWIYSEVQALIFNLSA